MEGVGGLKRAGGCPQGVRERLWKQACLRSGSVNSGPARGGVKKMNKHAADGVDVFEQELSRGKKIERFGIVLKLVTSG